MGLGSTNTFLLEVIDPTSGLPLSLVEPGAQVNIRVRAASGIAWKGLLLQSTTSGSFGGAVAGSFGILPPGFKNGPCPSGSSVTHNTRFNGVSIDFPWTAPAQTGTVTFVGFFVVNRFDSQNSEQTFFVEVAEAAAPGNVETSLRIARSTLTPGDLTLTWNPSCAQGAVDYAIYEGTLGDFTSHVQKDCSDDGAELTEEIAPAFGNTYYLLVATSADKEGSYGKDSQDQERPAAVLPGDRCIETQLLGGCIP